MNAQIPRVLCAAFDEIKIITIFNYINWAHGQVYIAISLLYSIQQRYSNTDIAIQCILLLLYLINSIGLRCEAVAVEPGDSLPVHPEMLRN